MRQKIIDFINSKKIPVSEPFLEYNFYQKDNFRLIHDINLDKLTMVEYIDEFPYKIVTCLDIENKYDLAIKIFGI